MKNKIPAYRLHKPTGQAVVRLDGRDYYLGKSEVESSRQKYRRLLAKWLSSPGPFGNSGPPLTPASALTIDELALAYWAHAESYYRKPDGTPTAEPAKI